MLGEETQETGPEIRILLHIVGYVGAGQDRFEIGGGATRNDVVTPASSCDDSQ